MGDNVRSARVVVRIQYVVENHCPEVSAQDIAPIEFGHPTDISSLSIFDLRLWPGHSVRLYTYQDGATLVSGYAGSFARATESYFSDPASKLCAAYACPTHCCKSDKFNWDRRSWPNLTEPRPAHRLCEQFWHRHRGEAKTLREFRRTVLRDASAPSVGEFFAFVCTTIGLSAST